MEKIIPFDEKKEISESLLKQLIDIAEWDIEWFKLEHTRRSLAIREIVNKVKENVGYTK